MAAMVDASELLRFVAACGVIALVLCALAALSRRHVGAGPFSRRKRLIEVIETLPLPHASSLHVVRLGNAYFAIGRTERGISLLTAIPTQMVENRPAAGESGRAAQRASRLPDAPDSPATP